RLRFTGASQVCDRNEGLQISRSGISPIGIRDPKMAGSGYIKIFKLKFCHLMGAQTSLK
ncbi:hypothetical protein HAX54_010447, partial [Datura stramonium]|nr:hypothetical protein [Datura stramonium]